MKETPQISYIFDKVMGSKKIFTLFAFVGKIVGFVKVSTFFDNVRKHILSTKNCYFYFEC